MNVILQGNDKILVGEICTEIMYSNESISAFKMKLNINISRE